MDECFSAFEMVAPHHHVAQACLHSACSRHLRQRTQITAMECFEECTHHVGRKVPQEDWPVWSDILSSDPCDDETDDKMPAAENNHNKPVVVIPAPPEDRLACADEKLWQKLTAFSEVSADVRLVCLNAMCDNNVACAKQCHEHVSKRVNEKDLSEWTQCTYSPACNVIKEYAQREMCADRCLQQHKDKLRREAEKRKEERKRKDAEALMSGSSTVKSAFVSVFTLMILKTLLI